MLIILLLMHLPGPVFLDVHVHVLDHPLDHYCQSHHC